MNEQSYEEYIRNILGYPNATSNSSFNNSIYNADLNTMSNIQNTDNSILEECYPEIYRIIYPMIIKTCRSNTMPITRELIENMTDEIYSAIEPNNNEIGINITLNNQVETTIQNRNLNYTENKNNHKEIKEGNTESKKEVRGEDRQFKNRDLRDLIKILLIREFLGRPVFNVQRPPFQRPPRPPFPGTSSGRPPIMPRNTSLYEDLYE